MKMFDSTSDLIAVFDFNNSAYKDIISLRDVKVGFSIQREYPDSGRFKAPKLPSGVPDSVALLYVIYAPKEFSVDRVKKDLVPVDISVTIFSKWISNHFEYNFADVNCPTKESIEASRKTPRPLGVSVECFFNHENNKFISANGREYSPIQMLDLAYNAHVETTGPLITVTVASREWIRLMFQKSVEFIRYYLLEKTWQWEIEEPSGKFRYSIEGYPESVIRKRPLKEHVLFGYPASVNVIVLFVTIVIVLFSVAQLFDLTLPFVVKILQSSFLTLVFSLFCLYVLDSFVPKLLFMFMNMLIRFRARFY